MQHFALHGQHSARSVATFAPRSQVRDLPLAFGRAWPIAAVSDEIRLPPEHGYCNDEFVLQRIRFVSDVVEIIASKRGNVSDFIFVFAKIESRKSFNTKSLRQNFKIKNNAFAMLRSGVRLPFAPFP